MIDHGAASAWRRWEDLRRHEVRDVGADALVIVPVGAVEQHGPHLPTGTDIALVSTVTERALELAAPESPRPFVLASFLRIGCSAHHLPFGGTISLSAPVMIGVLVDAISSMSASGVRRVVLVNGHGGNTGVCHAAAAELASRHGMTVAALDYWEFAHPAPDVPIPGHAGKFETSLMLTFAETVAPRHETRSGDQSPQPGRGVYGPEIWAGIDGYTDQPAAATEELGRSLLDQVSRGLADRLRELAGEMP
ncbi:creatinine amidohydrolase [Pseudoclavibacter endophyticus]|uniref:Creatininase family protein n=1 Tax=Pseudoclavibacter endophyticus TaxID=1778590 RepID=A0A6H9WQC2_9MICO|nr:creatininase family protein [Pseudoclavibacter endophyticus]KAB1648225.1 creatininase family protein [Pseudoclavibacter endophyticus]GGA70804.1 creatinine amidohydrolase [Pseudoclavibacter endophyticus]